MSYVRGDKKTFRGLLLCVCGSRRSRVSVLCSCANKARDYGHTTHTERQRKEEGRAAGNDNDTLRVIIKEKKEEVVEEEERRKETITTTNKRKNDDDHT